LKERDQYPITLSIYTVVSSKEGPHSVAAFESSNFKDNLVVRFGGARPASKAFFNFSYVLVPFRSPAKMG
jgi:hypothetical protein